MYTLVYIKLLVKPSTNRYASILAYQALGSHLKPYRAFLSLHTWVRLSWVSKPSSYFMYTSSSITPFKDAVLTSIWWICHPIWAARDITNLIEVYLEPREKVSSESIPYFYAYPFFHEPILVLFHTTIYNIFDLVDPSRTHNWFVFRPWNHLQKFIHHDIDCFDVQTVIKNPLPALSSSINHLRCQDYLSDMTK